MTLTPLTIQRAIAAVFGVLGGWAMIHLQSVAAPVLTSLGAVLDGPWQSGDVGAVRGGVSGPLAALTISLPLRR